MWSYSGDPRSSLLDAIRFEVQDTNEKAPLLQNEEIEYTIAQEVSANPPSEGEVLSAAARCMEALARLFAMQADKQAGALHIQYAKQSQNYTERARAMRLRAQNLHSPWAGGLSHAEKELLVANKDYVQPAFKRGFGKNPYAAFGAQFIRIGEESREGG